MVKFILKTKDDKTLTYECTTAKELNEMRDAINQMRIENGEPELTEDELPIATEDESWYWYGDHAINSIWKAFCEGKELPEGTVMWY